jgi:hypothetical protein
MTQLEPVIQNNRDRPKIYIDDALGILIERIKKGTTYDIDIIEIGCMRSSLNHDINNISHPCCNDGHSTYLFAKTGLKCYSVDISLDHVMKAKESCSDFNNIKIIAEDAITYAGYTFNKKIRIGLLFLDAWDLDLVDSALKHLEFYNIIKNNINDDCLILIDDTDLLYDQNSRQYYKDNSCLAGKGKLLIPELINDGYKIFFNGRQTLLGK